MEEIILRGFNCPEYTFRVVERVPNNYFVWNISQIEETGCYIPFAKRHPMYTHMIGGTPYSIDPDSLLAVKVTKREANYLRYAAGIGVNSKSVANKLVESNHREKYRKEQKRYAEKVIDVFRRLYM